MSRIKISIGEVHIEYEGEQDFIENRLLQLAEDLIGLSDKIPSVMSEVSAPHNQHVQHEASTNTVAQIIGVKTGSELALAAIARIILIKNRPVAGRQEILDEMKEATTFFKESYASNLSSYLDTLLKSKRVNLVSRATYGLAAGERSRLQQALDTAA